MTPTRSARPARAARPAPAGVLALLLGLCACSAVGGPAPAMPGTTGATPAPQDAAQQDLGRRPRPVGRSGPRLAFSIGERSLDRDFEPVEDQLTLGLELSQRLPGWAVGWELGLQGSYDDERVGGIGDVESSTWELYGGLRKTFLGPDAPARPYVGAGAALIGARFEVPGADDDDTSLGAYLHGGIEFQVTPGLLLGFDARCLFASDIELFGVDSDADYTQLSVFLAAVL